MPLCPWLSLAAHCWRRGCLGSLRRTCLAAPFAPAATDLSLPSSPWQAGTISGGRGRGDKRTQLGCLSGLQQVEDFTTPGLPHYLKLSFRKPWSRTNLSMSQRDVLGFQNLTKGQPQSTKSVTAPSSGDLQKVPEDILIHHSDVETEAVACNKHDRVSDFLSPLRPCPLAEITQVDIYLHSFLV